MDYKKHLVDCPHCGGKILDHMTECPLCGGKVEIKGYRPMDDEKAAKIKKITTIISIAVFAVIIIYTIITRLA